MAARTSPRRTRRIGATLTVCAAAGAALASPALAAGATEAKDANSLAPVIEGDAASVAETLAITRAYVTEFYPLWFTYLQTKVAPHNQLIGPNKISPLYQAVVAINDDTVYANTPVNVGSEPVILTVPSTRATYSVLNLDVYGNVFESGIQSQRAGATYALVAPGWSGDLPDGATRIEMPHDLTVLIFRADRFSGTTDQTLLAKRFRKNLKLQTLTDYEKDPSGGGTNVLPVAEFGIPFKTLADRLATKDPLVFLEILQNAVKSSNTPTLTPAQQALSDAFDARFGDGGAGLDILGKLAASRGTRAAHRAILNRYLGKRDRNNWIHFTNIGDWGTRARDRAAITEFIQYGNSIKTAAYYHAFRDGKGKALNGRDPRGYVLTFPKGGTPDASRFWSVTAYTPNAIEPIPNALGKYVVGSYTPGLRKGRDGSISIYVSRRKPVGVAKANWLPVGRRDFNVMLRVYGVVSGSSVANNTYVPPAITRRVASP